MTPLNVPLYLQLLTESDYNRGETEFLVNGFTKGFDIGYKGPLERQSEANNLPFKPGVGNKVEMWNKIMKEVKLKRVAGPFSKIPFKNYIQSPIGLVPKDGNKKTRLIFHLSYQFKSEPSESVNGCTPRDLCTVKYNDLDSAVTECLKVSETAMRVTGSKRIFLGKMDLTSAFHVLCMNFSSICWLIFKAEDPSDGKMKYFVDKCLPFGASISCSHYQRFSNSLKHILQHRLRRNSLLKELPVQAKATTNYLDDFLFIAIAKWICNFMVQQFLTLCKDLSLPVAEGKTEWATSLIVFLGILIDGINLLLLLPLEKQQKALKLLNDLMGKKRIKVKQLQSLTGYLNFLTRAIFPGRTFTRRIYSKYSNLNASLRPYHHVAVDTEFRFDCEIWRFFLNNFQNSAVC